MLPEQLYTENSGQILTVHTTKTGEILTTNHAFRLQFGKRASRTSASLFTVLNFDVGEHHELTAGVNPDQGLAVVMRSVADKERYLFHIYEYNGEFQLFGLRQPMPDSHYANLLSELTTDMGNLVRESHRLNQDLQRSNQQVLKLSQVDGLTQLLNHATFMKRIEAQVEHSHRHEHPCSMLMLDIDHFKLVNDNYGHQQGDAVLSQLGQLLKEAVRAGDIAARYGGEEFAVLMPDTALDSAQILAERIRTQTEILKPLGEKHPITISIGAAELKPEESTGQLISRADNALYAAKKSGRNRVCLGT